MSNLVTAIFDTISAAVTNFTTMVTTSLNSLVSIFYNSTTHQFEFLGILALVGIGIGLVWALIRLLRGTIRRV